MKNNVKMKMQTPSYFLRVSTIISLLIIFNVTICLAQNPKLETIDSGGFLTSHWTQDYPYNQLCPRDPVNNYSYSYAGCPAVAMGQILNFLRTTQETRFPIAMIIAIIMLVVIIILTMIGSPYNSLHSHS